MSIIGITANWSCHICSVTAKTFQIQEAALKIALDPPRDWNIYENRTYCGDHDLVLPQQKLAA